MTALAVWLVLGLAVGLAAGLVFGPAFGFVFGLSVWLAFGSVSGLMSMSEVRIDDFLPRIPGPREPLRADGYNGMMAGLALGSVFGLVFGFADWFLSGTATGFVFGLTVGFVIGFAFTTGHWARYHCAVAVNALQGRVPWRFGEFLDWGVRAGLLRVSGIAYQFRHQQLQDWLSTSAEQAPTESA